jgi:5-formyltetrahydrofolate cyclo-ligase
MDQTIQSEKACLRMEMKRRLGEMTEQERQSGSTQICDRLLQQNTWQSAHSILFYRPLPREPDIMPLVAAAQAGQKDIAFPRYDAEQDAYLPHLIFDPGRDLVAGRYGIPEPTPDCKPVALNQLDLILVPGLCFDRAGHRLGRGKGYYDRLLRAARGTLCGTAFEFQILDALPVEPHDVQLSCILTPMRWRETRQATRGY